MKIIPTLESMSFSSQQGQGQGQGQQPGHSHAEQEDDDNFNMTGMMKVMKEEDEEHNEEDDVMTDHSSTTSSSMQEDDDSMGSLDGAIPSMAQFYNEEEESETYSEGMDDSSSPSIYYMGREYSADQFRNSASVLSQSSLSNQGGGGGAYYGGRRASNMTTRLLDISDHRTNDRWSLLESEVMALSPKGRSSTGGNSNSKKMSKSEHYNSSRRRYSRSPKRRSNNNNNNHKMSSIGGGGAISPIPNTRGTRVGSGGGGGRQRRASIAIGAVPPLPIDVSPKATTTTSSSSKSSRIGRFFNDATSAAATAMGTQSEYFGGSSTRRRASVAIVPGSSNHSGGSGGSGMSHSGNNQTTYRGGRRASSAGDYMRQAVGKFINLQTPTEEQKKKERWQHSLERWGYTNHDVLGIVEDDRIFAKLQADLRQYQAVTNNVIQQKIHVFVSNTKMRRHTLHQQAQPQHGQPRAVPMKSSRRTQSSS